MKYTLRVAVVVVLAAGVLPACATKSFVNKNVADVNQKVETLTRTLDETRDRHQVTEARLGEVDQTAQRAQDGARQAQSTATSAADRANAVGRKADALELASKRVMYTVVLSEDEGRFAFGQSALPDHAVPNLDALAEKVKADPQGAFFEIEGHTDATGPREYNERLGLARAEAVKRYLYEKHMIPLHRMNAISYGPEKPVAPNSTREGRAQNRRVVIKVLV